ncbi:hypothetical protein NQ314_003022 [Rhamnusium bicolor]|uniref:Uncharacterized protein n=1 Tax=Rhamnusium bicolor TaxID=1586634 RepID=A0AAV8ZN71_9CUCU|nr:hypothetical protein NQ314_003022 [Rhamnusium bicolor]
MNGRLSDGCVFWNSDLSKAIEDNTLYVAEDKDTSCHSSKCSLLFIKSHSQALSATLNDKRTKSFQLSIEQSSSCI